MANLTIAIDDELLKQARIRAVHGGTSVSAVVCDYLTDYVGLTKKREAAVKDLLRLSKQSTARRGPADGRGKIYISGERDTLSG